MSRASRVVRRAVAAASSSPRACSWCSRGVRRAPGRRRRLPRRPGPGGVVHEQQTELVGGAAVASAAAAPARRWSRTSPSGARGDRGRTARRAGGGRSRARRTRRAGLFGERGLDLGASLDEPRPPPRSGLADSRSATAASATPLAPRRRRRAGPWSRSAPRGRLLGEVVHVPVVGSGASVASLTRLTRSATPGGRTSDRRRSSILRSRNQRSTSSNRPVRNSCWSSRCRSSDRAAGTPGTCPAAASPPG